MARLAITEQELIAALAEAARGSAPEDARTPAQFAASANVPLSRVMKTLRALHAQGRVVSHRIPHTGIDGRSMMVPAYTILPAKAKR